MNIKQILKSLRNAFTYTDIRQNVVKSSKDAIDDLVKFFESAPAKKRWGSLVDPLIERTKSAKGKIKSFSFISDSKRGVTRYSNEFQEGVIKSEKQLKKISANLKKYFSDDEIDMMKTQLKSGKHVKINVPMSDDILINSSGKFEKGIPIHEVIHFQTDGLNETSKINYHKVHGNKSVTYVDNPKTVEWTSRDKITEDIMAHNSKYTPEPINPELRGRSAGEYPFRDAQFKSDKEWFDYINAQQELRARGITSLEEELYPALGEGINDETKILAHLKTHEPAGMNLRQLTKTYTPESLSRYLANVKGIIPAALIGGAAYGATQAT